MDRELAQGLRTLSAFHKDLSSILSTHIRKLTTTCNSNSRAWSPHDIVRHIHIRTDHGLEAFHLVYTGILDKQGLHVFPY